MKAIDLWDHVSRTGVHPALDRQLERKVILCNQIGLSIGLALFLGSVNHLAWGYSVLAPFMMVFSILYFLVIYLNRRGYHTLSRIYLNVLPPLLITLLSGLILYRDPSFRFAMIPVILVPILLFGIAERVKMLAGLAWVVFAFLMMDSVTPLIPKLQDVAISEAEISFNALINGLITIFMFSASFVYFQRLNRKAERELSETLHKVQAQKEIIERQQKEEQEQAALTLAKQREVNALKSTFVAMTSHEFRTPLAAIHSSQELLRDFGDRFSPSERTELLLIVEASVQRMTAMLDKILIIGRADADLLEFRPTLMNLASVCRQLVDEVMQSSKGSHAGTVPIALRIDLGGDEVARLDENLLRHCLGNLLSNAVKYSHQGDEAALVVRRLSNAIVFEVIDQGIGVPAGDIPHLFETFHRAGNVGNIPGTGLGLAIVMRAVDRHGGTIEVTSELGRGTRFSIVFPQA